MREEKQRRVGVAIGIGIADNNADTDPDAERVDMRKGAPDHIGRRLEDGSA
jgi:hypothetical protein